ncbi:unnamed protein product, partial [Dicrocoelium dendriticum]
TTAPTVRTFFRRVPCRHTHGRTLCRHSRCRRLKWHSKAGGLHSQADTVSTKSTGSSSEGPEPDAHVLTCLQDCVQRIREPFTPEEQLETGVAVTLEQEYNRMDACIRRIIRVVKLLPFFGEIGKAAQLTLLRDAVHEMRIFKLIWICSIHAYLNIVIWSISCITTRCIDFNHLQSSCCAVNVTHTLRLHPRYRMQFADWPWLQCEPLNSRFTFASAQQLVYVRSVIGASFTKPGSGLTSTHIAYLTAQPIFCRSDSLALFPDSQLSVFSGFVLQKLINTKPDNVQLLPKRLKCTM